MPMTQVPVLACLRDLLSTNCLRTPKKIENMIPYQGHKGIISLYSFGVLKQIVVVGGLWVVTGVWTFGAALGVFESLRAEDQPKRIGLLRR